MPGAGRTPARRLSRGASAKVVLKRAFPWWTKILGKIVLSRLPVGRRVWKKIGLFEAGHAEDPLYAHRVFKRHFDRVSFPRAHGGWVGLEIGPGDSLLSALIMRAYGASNSYLVDVGHFATDDVERYRDMVRLLAQEGLPAPDIQHVKNLNCVLAVCNSSYMTEGLSSLRSVPAGSVDFVWSQAVLEHIRRSEFDGLMRETRRVLRPGGISSHRIDLRDHLASSLNNLRFSERIWESNWMARSGFYTNRIRFSEMIRLFESAGFSVETVEVNRWDNPPIPRRKLSGAFGHLPDEELSVSGFDVILRPA